MRSIAFTLALLLCSTGMADVYNWTAPADYHSSVGRIVVPSRAAGTAVYVKYECAHFVLTAAHITNGHYSAKITFPGGQTAEGVPTPDKTRADLSAVLTGKIPGLSPVEISPLAVPGNGAFEICGFGGPRKLSLRHFTAHIVARGNVLQTADGRVTYGDSGGPWFLAGKLVGIQSMGAGAIGVVAKRFDIFTTCNSARTPIIRDFMSRVHQKLCTGGT